ILVIHASTLPKYPPNNKMDANQFPYTGLSQTMTPASGFTLAGTKRKDNNAASTLTYNQPAGSVSISFAKPTFGLKVPLNLVRYKSRSFMIWPKSASAYILEII
ncbi:unnamed protein product, partial [Brassica oleracea]